MRREFRFSHWSFMFAEIALWSFAVLMVTGAILMFFFDPSMAPVTYDGTYAPLRGTQVSRAFDSTMHLSLEVRGGLLIRQMHHWAALVFVAAVALQLLRMFATAAYRRPRTAQWLIWVALLPLGMAAGETGHILPDDMLSGGSLWLIKSVLQSLPLVGSYGVMLLFGTDFPGESVITTLYWGHALVIPAVMAALLGARAWLVRRNGHTHFTDAAPARPGARPLMAVATLGMLIVLGFAFQVAPIWLYGPARPTQISAGSVPDWYMGFLDGALRLMPGWEVTIGGYTLSLAVLVPVIVLPGAFFTVLALYPLAERRLLKGRPASVTLERPRQAPARTAIAVAGVAFYGLLWASAANDQFAHQFQLTVETVTIFFRYAVVIGPVVAFLVTRWICLGLQSADRHVAEHGVETGVIVRSPDGGFHERLVPAGHAIAPREGDQTSEE